jgi:hypothetical protein
MLQPPTHASKLQATRTIPFQQKQAKAYPLSPITMVTSAPLSTLQKDLQNVDRNENNP